MRRGRVSVLTDQTEPNFAIFSEISSGGHGLALTDPVCSFPAIESGA